MANIYRIRGDNGEIYRPYINSNGEYVLAKQETDQPLNYSENQVFVRAESEMISKIRNERFYLRMKGDITGQINLISPDEIIVEE